MLRSFLIALGAALVAVVLTVVVLGTRQHVSVTITSEARQPARAQTPLAWTATWSRATKAVVVVRSRATTTGADSQGTGAFISPDGLVLTAAHVLRSPDDSPEVVAKDVWVDLADGRQLSATVVGWEPVSDLALLKVDIDSPATLPWRPGSEPLAVGEHVATLGAPYGQAESLSVGIVSGVDRSIPSGVSKFAINQAIQTDAAVNPGNSGGPLIDVQGRLLGVVVRFESDTRVNSGVGYALGAARVQQLLGRLRAGGLVRLGYAGIAGQTLTPFLARQLGTPVDSGVLVARVDPAGPAAKAGMRTPTGTREIAGEDIPVATDIITAVNNTPVATSAQLADLLSSLAPGTKATLDVVDASGARRTRTLTLSSRALR